ncbi:hypothetical protein CC1G_13180 [Coprinopsis cinerea okayama7|uniref:Uncharacterized protein n=1 Tax=Coprinopsis cinerea (strain Okayama-7 / 130 / ATCC MYA-4618 / FGSC 9003) TaxID=240176 RepID=A8NL06_COPC7|nr:hypothetical protein CC1G_13180 [Coprinopsis cinerea okayama7\|eukprot:XP_001834586.2 hypothetical protein CC1G_13180 [Coprinopsis cinerea okayama7\
MVPGFQTRWWLETTPLPLSSTNLDPLPPPASLPPLVSITSEDWKPQGSNCGAGSKRMGPGSFDTEKRNVSNQPKLRGA